MTDQIDFMNFIKGLIILRPYKDKYFSIDVVEFSSIVVQGLLSLIKDLLSLRSIGWEASNNDGIGWAQ